MHANISITEGIYGRLSESDIKEQVTSLPNKSLTDEDKSLFDLLRMNQEIIAKLEAKLK